MFDYKIVYYYFIFILGGLALTKKLNYIAQVDERDRGVAAVVMVLAHYKTRLSLAKLRDLAKTDMEGTTKTKPKVKR